MAAGYQLSGLEAARLLREGVLDLEEYVAALYDRIEKLNLRLKAFITVRPREEVLRELKESLERGRPLSGLVVAVKDNIHVRGLPVTCGSRMLSKYTAVYDATVVEKLREQGAVVLGKTNMDEFAMGSTGETSAYGAARNPWSPDKVPGGSSSGTAVALAAGMAPMGLGSDTGGSIRLPASWTGLYGLKPTYGRVSRYGLVSYADSLEQIGPMARTVEDLAALFDAIAGFDPRDSTSLQAPASALETVKRAKEQGVEGTRIGLVREFLEHPGVDERIKRLVEAAADGLSRQGVEVVEVGLGAEAVEYALPAYYVIAMAEASSNLARYDGIRYGPGEPPRPWEGWNTYYSRIRSTYFGAEVKLRIMLGSWMLSSGYKDQYYIRALRLRRLVRDRLLEALRGLDALLLPSAVAPPPRLGEVIGDPEKLYALDLANVLANLSGLPALVAPAGRVEDIPIGVQLMGAPMGDEKLLALAAALEQETGLSNLVAEPTP